MTGVVVDAVSLIVPEEGVIVIQEAFTVAAHVLSPERLFERTTVWGDGSVPPLVAENVRALGLNCKAHNGFTTQRSIANVNAVPPSILDIVCRIALCAGCGSSYESF